MKAWEGLEMTNADWWARLVQARTERDLRPQRVWTLHKGEHAAAIDLEAVSGIGGRSCSLWTESGARLGWRARPATVRGPVLRPPCIRQRRFVRIAGA